VNIARHMMSLLLIAIVAISSPAYGEERVQKNGFSISLPDGWVEIPRGAIDSYEKTVAELAPNAPAQHYDCGFQLESGKNWFEYPYVLIQVKNIGRIPESQLEKLEGVSLQKTLDDQKDRLSTIMSGAQAGKMIYDRQNRMIWMRMEFNVRDVGPVTGICGMIPTEKGFIQVNGYCAKNIYSRYEQILRAIATSMTPDPALIYKPKWSDSLPAVVTGIDWGRIAGKALAGAVVGGIIALIVGFIRKKKRD